MLLSLYPTGDVTLDQVRRIHEAIKYFTFVTLPREMSHIATLSLFGYSDFPKVGATYRFWSFNGISFSSFLRQKNTLVTHTPSLKVSLVCYVFKTSNLSIRAINVIWRFLKMILSVLATLHCHNFKTSGQILIICASF